MKSYSYANIVNDEETKRAKKLLKDLAEDKKVDVILVFVARDNVKDVNLKMELLQSMLNRIKTSKFSAAYKKEYDEYLRLIGISTNGWITEEGKQK